MSGPAIALTRPSAVRPQGLARDLPLLLFGDALLLVGALTTWLLDCTLEQTMAALGIVAAVSLAITAWFAALYYAELRCHGFLVLQAAWAYWYFVPMLLTALRGAVVLDSNQRQFTPAEISLACVAVCLARFVSSLIYQIVLARPVINIARIANWLNRRLYPMPILPVAVLLALGLVPFVLSGKPVLSAILGSRSASGIFPASNLSPGLFVFTAFLTACCLLGFYRFLVSPARSAKWICFLLAITALAVSALALSTRTMLLASVMPVLTFYLLSSTNRWRVLKVALCLAGLWLASDLLVSSRQQGFLQPGKPSEKMSRNLVDNDFFGELLYAMSAVPVRVSHDYRSPIALAIVTLIPRAVWPNKPIPVTGEKVMLMRVKYSEGRELTGNILPGIIGQYWEHAGWLGVVIAGIWLGLAAASCDRMVIATDWQIRYLSFAFLWALFISFRTVALGNLLPFILCSATVLALSRRRPAESS